jgi:hypothetical protein
MQEDMRVRNRGKICQKKRCTERQLVELVQLRQPRDASGGGSLGLAGGDNLLQEGDWWRRKGDRKRQL